MSDVPAHIPISVLAKACRLSRRAARGLVRRAGILVLDGSRAVAPRTAFRERLPDHYEDVLRWYREQARAGAGRPGEALASAGRR